MQDFIIGKQAWQSVVGGLKKFDANPACVLLACKLVAQRPIDSVRTQFLWSLTESMPSLTTVATAMAGVELVTLGKQISTSPLLLLIHCMNSSSGITAKPADALHAV